VSAIVIGRGAELEAIDRLLESLAGGPAALLLEGEPGIGKTTLMRAGVEAAADHGARVLACAPSAPETRLAYAALADLLAGIGDGALEPLPAPQRDALAAALLRADPGVADVQGRAVATGLLSLLEGLADEGPVLLAIDDLQWLDRPTARVVEFAARRLTGRVGLLASRRTGEHSATIELRAPERLERRELAPLEIGELGRVVGERAQRRLTPAALARVHETSGGNPFYALELARLLPADGPLPATLPLPASLEEIVAARLSGIDGALEEVLLAVATLADPTVELLERALRRDVVELLDEAELRGVLEIAGGHVRFTHPLLASGVYARAPNGRRRALHQRLSSAVSDVEERARHLALAGAPDAIAALDEGARSVRARGAPDAAAELLELALGLGGGPELRVRAAEHHFDAGDAHRAQALLEEAIPLLADGSPRAQALLMLGEFRYKDDSFPEAHELLERARAEAEGDERLLSMIELRQAYTHYNLARPQEAATTARSALRRARQLDDQGLIAQALALTVIADFALGRGLDEPGLRTALDLQVADLRTGAEFYPALIASFLFLWVGAFDEARTQLDAVRALYAARGEQQALAWSCFICVWLETWSGDLAAADRWAEEAAERLDLLGTVNGQALGLAAQAQADAYAGRVEEGRRHCQESQALFESAGWGWSWFPRMARGFLELSARDPEAALDALEPLADAAVASGLPEPVHAGMLFSGDAAEALVAVGRIDEAEALVRLLEQRGAALDRPWALAVGARCRGLILAAGADVAGAERALERALAAHERLAMPIERGRSLLVLGRLRRRLRKRRAAKAALDEALAIFEAVGSPVWAEQVRAEIACLGLRPGTPDELTASEQRVAALAAAGMTNREVAASLSISPKTVEAHLARAYRKLGIRSRAELGSRMAQRA
jgi:DNA-binding CsgD family transcriptional regulator